MKKKKVRGGKSGRRTGGARFNEGINWCPDDSTEFSPSPTVYNGRKQLRTGYRRYPVGNKPRFQQKTFYGY